METDSLDILGIPKFLPSDFKYKNVFKGKFKQKYPRYSSKVISMDGKSKPLWWWEKQGKLKECMIPEKEVEIYDIEKINEKNYTSKVLMEIIINRISKLSEVNRKKFRYNEIKDKWGELLDINKNFKILNYRANVSSGTYIRGICQKMGGVAFDINRTNIIF